MQATNISCPQTPHLLDWRPSRRPLTGARLLPLLLPLLRRLRRRHARIPPTFGPAAAAGARRCRCCSCCRCRCCCRAFGGRGGRGRLDADLDCKPGDEL